MKLELDCYTFGQIPLNTAGEIIDYAKEIGISSIDTAALYSGSESALGRLNIEDFDVITKTVKIDRAISRQENFELFREAFYQSQRNLGYIELYGLMFQSAQDLLSEQGLALWDLVNDFKDKEYVYKLGTAVTEPEELADILDTVDIDIVQIPLNLLDQRFIGMLPELKRKRIEVHTRGTFLQGLILMNRYQIPEYFREIIPVIASIPEPKAAYALSFPKLIKEIDKISIGVRSKRELEEIFSMYNFDVETVDYSVFRVDKPEFINPSVFNINM